MMTKGRFHRPFFNIPSDPCVSMIPGSGDADRTSTAKPLQGGEKGLARKVAKPFLLSAPLMAAALHFRGAVREAGVKPAEFIHEGMKLRVLVLHHLREAEVQPVERANQ